jgi:RsiW-degrading membrane proteinase PrsW (M82 family)
MVGYPYPYGWYVPVGPPRVPGETYRKVLSIICIVATSLLLLGALLGLALFALLDVSGSGQDLSIINLLVMGILASLAGGAAGLYHSIQGLRRRPSAPFSLPRFWLLFALTIVILGAGIALFAAKQPTGPVELIEPLVLLSGIVPAMTVLALGLQVLRPQVSWRHAWLALTTGATLSILIASLLELVLALILLGAASLNVDLSNFNPNSSFGTIAILILVAGIAPLVEETTKQISGFFLLPRIKGPQEAFLIGLAAGIGFAMLETAGYIGSAQADWVGIALGRVGAGLLHGMGAAMAGVGWYYLVKGKGVRGRWRLAILFLAYAYVQHAIFNGGQVLLALITPLQNWHVDFLDLRLDISSVYAGVLYVIILGIMLLVIRWLRQSAPTGANTPTAGRPAPGAAQMPYASTPGASGMGRPIASASPPNPLSVGEPGGREPGGDV